VLNIGSLAAQKSCVCGNVWSAIYTESRGCGSGYAVMLARKSVDVLIEFFLLAV
jgi:hypothetical protein